MWAMNRAWESVRHQNFGDNFWQTLSPKGSFTHFVKYSKASKGGSSWVEFIIMLIVFLAAIYILTPREFEIGGESWTSWSAARVLRDTFGFPVFSLGPFYILYLNIFLPLGYPLAVKTEFILTHLFVYVVIYYLLKRKMPCWIALLLSLAWIPLITYVVGTKYVLGMGFFALYLIGGTYEKKKSIFPPFLGLAFLCNYGYIAFYVGHLCGVIVEIVNRKQCFSKKTFVSNRRKIINISINTIVLIIIGMTIFFPSERKDNNHHMNDPVYYPEYTGSLSMVFLQKFNHYYSRKYFPESSQIYRDWYLTNKEATGGAKTIYQAIKNNPEDMLPYIKTNIKGVIRLIPSYFLLSQAPRAVSMLGTFLMYLGFLGLLLFFFRNSNFAYLFGIIFGFSAFLGTFFIVGPGGRFIMSLLPLGLLILSFLPLGLDVVLKWLSLLSRRNAILTSVFVCLFAILMVVVAFKQHNSIEFILSLCLAIIFLILAYKKRTQIYYYLQRKGNLVCQGVFIMSFLFVANGAIHHFQNPMKQFNAILSGVPLFTDYEKKVSMNLAYKELFSTISSKSRILGTENHFLMAFSDIPIDHIYQTWSLPPYKEHSEEIVRFFEKLNIIWVNDNWIKGNASMATQSYIRYLYYVKPFLDKAVKRGWKEKTIKYYGKVYTKPEKM